ncbi:Cyclic nucleotide-binding protein [Pseudocohnilembus persalinus]|uniref:Cyclic nucleotide-binding protein n=1 Tax=Pseudocohnilembus persalinus TaxID=266149 RepID=A0A0V0R0B1_PSEPJ|nr:Cyclic nucleotide-binding protein [Pseudocohnilembus persalinus]|eukprot:KRX07950.1 Cyclic nucleotide-binding protein [Pseudocohnilembus persalinus]
MERTGVKRGNLFHQSNHSQLILLNSQKDENLQDDISLTSFQQSNQSVSYSNRSKPQNQYLEKISDDINECQSPEKNNDMDEYNNNIVQNRFEQNGTNQNNFNRQIIDNMSDDFAKNQKSILKSPDQNQSSFLQIEETKKQSSSNDIQQIQQNFQQLQQQQNSQHDSIDRYSSKQVNQNIYPNQRQQLINDEGDGNGYDGEEDETNNKQEDRYYGTFNYYENYGKQYSRNKYSNYKMNSMNQSKANQQIVKDRINKIIRNKIEIQNEEMQVQKNIQNILRQEQEEQMKNNEFRQFIQKIKLKHFFTMIANNLESRSLMWIAIIFFIIQAWVKINTGIFKEGRITYVGSTGDTFYETLYTTIILFFTVGIFAYVLENISQTINKLTKDSAQYKTNLETLNIFMKNKSLDQQTQTKVRQQLEHSYKANQQITINQQARFVLEQLPDNLSVQIQNQINSALVQKFKPLCRNFSDKTLELVCKNSNIFSEVSYVAQETILNQNEQQDIYLYYIVAGKVELFVQEQQQQDESKRLHVFQELQEGDLFCLDNFFTGQPPKYSARSTVYSNICKIKRSGFLNVLKQNPQEHEKFHYIKDQILNCGKTKYFIKQCKICQNSNHFEDDCNLLVYRPKKLILAYKNNMENRVKQERQRYFRSISRQEVISAYAMIDNNEILNEHFREKYPEIYPDSDDLYTSYSDTTYTYESSEEDEQEQYGKYKAQVQRISKSFNLQQQSNLQNIHMNSILNSNQARESNIENQQILQQTQLPSMNHLGYYIQENDQQQNASGQCLNESQDQNDTSMQTLDVRHKKNTSILLNQSQNLSQQQSPQIQKDQIQPQLLNNQPYVQSKQSQNQQQLGSQKQNNFLSNQQIPQQQQQFQGLEPQFNASYLQFEIFTTIKQIISNQIKHQTNILKKQQHKQNKELNMFLQKQNGGQNPQFNKKIYSKSRTQNERSTEKNPSGYLSNFLRNKKKKQTMNKKPTPFQQIFQNNNINFFQNTQQQNNSSQLQNNNLQQQIEQTNNQKESNNKINNNTNINTNNNTNNTNNNTNNNNENNNNMQDSLQETSPTKVRFQQQQKKMSQNLKKMTLNKQIEIPNLAQQRPYDENEILFLEFDQQHNFSIYYPTYNIVYLLKLFRESLDEKGNQKKMAHARESKFRMNNLLYKEVHGKKVKKDSKKKKNKSDNTQNEQ